MADLPDFDTLLNMPREDPDALDRLRQELTAELVSTAHSDARRRLEGLQFRINMELRRAGNPTAGFLRLSDMMHESFAELNYCLNNPTDAIRERQTARQSASRADILELFPDSPAARPGETPTRH